MLKVLGVELTSIGRIYADASQGEREDVLEDAEALRYRKIVVDAEERCVGAILLGFPRDVPAVTAAVKAHAPGRRDARRRSRARLSLVRRRTEPAGTGD